MLNTTKIQDTLIKSIGISRSIHRHKHLHLKERGKEIFPSRLIFIVETLILLGDKTIKNS